MSHTLLIKRVNSCSAQWCRVDLPPQRFGDALPAVLTALELAFACVLIVVALCGCAASPHAAKSPLPAQSDPDVCDRRVVLKVMVGTTGRPVSAEVTKSSGHAVLDEAARTNVLTWAFRPGRPKTCLVPFEFYLPQRLGSSKPSEFDMDYPLEALRNGWEGTVVLRVKIGKNRRPTGVEVIQSSGHAILDDAASASMLRREFAVEAGTVCAIPIEFRLAR